MSKILACLHSLQDTGFTGIQETDGASYHKGMANYAQINELSAFVIYDLSDLGKVWMKTPILDMMRKKWPHDPNKILTTLGPHAWQLAEKEAKQLAQLIPSGNDWKELRDRYDRRLMLPTFRPRPHMTQSRTLLRVVARFQMQLAMEHSSPEEMKEYLHEHPQADPANHTVTKKEDHGGGGEHEHDAPKKSWKERLQGLGAKAKKFYEDAPAAVKQFFTDDAYRRTALMGAHKKLMDAPHNVVQHAITTVKNEVKEYKEAAAGVKAVIKGGSMTPEQKHAFKTLAKHMAITAAATALTVSGGPLALAGAFGKTLTKNLAARAAADILGHIDGLSEYIEIGEGIHKHVHHFLASDEDAKVDEGIAKFVMAKVAKQIQDLDMDAIEAALKEMDSE